MSSNCLLTAATISVLLCALLTAAFDLVELRTRPRRGHIASHRSKPEQKADALLKEWTQTQFLRGILPEVMRQRDYHDGVGTRDDLRSTSPRSLDDLG